MKVKVNFYSYFKDLAGVPGVDEEAPDGATVETVLQLVYAKYPKLRPMEKSMLIAVGTEYQARAFALRDGDEVSLFPPVQGG